jgi:translation initiation factor IF-3
VRLIDENGQMLGVMSSPQALTIARERDLDLVEVSPMASPPVCKLMDYGRFKYEQAQKEREARRNQKTIELKEIRMKPHTDTHDQAVKVRKIQEFLGEGDKVKVGVQFRGRELAHPELGRQLLEKIIVELKGVATIERPPIMEGKLMSMIVSRAPGWEPPKKAAPATQERQERQDRKAERPTATAPAESEQAESEQAATVTGDSAQTEAVPAQAIPTAAAQAEGAEAEGVEVAPLAGTNGTKGTNGVQPTPEPTPGAPQSEPAANPAP